MKIIKVNLKDRSYDIVIGNDILRAAGKLIKKLRLGGDAFIITNSGIKTLYGKRLADSLKKSGISARFKVVADSEKSKSIDTAIAVIKSLSQYDRKRQTFIIALGGGVIGDLAGFVASTYKRGIPYVQIPTTLLAQIDSAIGGKTAIDLKEGKNLVGAFYQPRLIVSDISCLKSLKPRQIKAGLAEAVKYGIIKDRQLFEFLRDKRRKILAADKQALEFTVARCSRIKAGIIEKDERETRSLRTILNFGHTIGHAIEAASGYAGYNHGEAIALGMLCAKDMSVKLKILKAADAEKIEQLINALGLPVKIRKVSPAKIIWMHYKDKKFIGAKNRFVLIKGIGLEPVIKENVPLEIIKEVIQRRIA